MKITMLLALVTCFGLFLGCDDGKAKAKTPAEPEQHTHDGAHGGKLVELGTRAHMEFLHNDAEGVVTAYFTGADAKSPLVLDSAPELKLTTAEGPKALTMTAVETGASNGSVFTLTHDLLKVAHLNGRVSVTIVGKTYNPDLESTHDH